MKIERAELRYVKIPLVTPFRTSFGTSYDKDTFLLHVVTDEAEGWAECGAERPLDSEEWLGGCEIVLRDQLLPRVLVLGPDLSAGRVKEALKPVKEKTPWPSMSSRPRSSTPSCAPPAHRSAATSARCATRSRQVSRSGSWTRSRSSWTPLHATGTMAT